MMEQAIRIDAFGGPEAMVWRDVDLAPPSPGEVRMRNTAIGLNFIDTYHRRGSYPIPLPSGIGIEMYLSPPRGRTMLRSRTKSGGSSSS